MSLDMSAALNYDAVGTANEISWISSGHPTGNRRLSDVLGDHNLGNSGRALTTTASLSSASALPPYGVVGNYMAPFIYDKTSSGQYVASPTCLRIIASAFGSTTVTTTGTVTLLSGQQLNYSNLNLLFVQNRSTSAGTFRTLITATYTDGTTTVLDTGSITVAANAPGGTLGSAGVAGQGGLSIGTDTNAAVTNVFTSPYGVTTTGAPGNFSSVIDPAVGSNLWQLTTPLALNTSKVLKSVAFQVQAAQAGQWNELAVFGLCATPVSCPPPPASDPSEAPNVTFDPGRLAGHPRLLMTPQSIPALRAFYNSTNGAIWRQQIDAYLGSCTVPTQTSFLTDATEAQRQGLWRLPTVALHYVLTGDATSFARALGFLQLYTALPDWETSIERNSGMSAANNMVGVALAFDWLYNDLDPVFRETVRQKLLLQARSLYYGGHLKGNSNISAIYWQLDPLNNHRWHRDAGLALAVMAAYSGASSENWILNRTAAELAFVNTWLPPDGTSHESVSYMIFGGNHLMLATQASDDCLGTHLIDQAFFSQVGVFRMQMELSSFNNMLNFGDFSGVDQGSYNNFLLRAAAIHRNADLRQGLVTLATLQPTAMNFNWFSLLWDDPTLNGGNYKNLPLTGYFDDLGLTTFRDSWTPGGVAAMFKCSPLGGRSLNVYRDLNNFTYVNVAHDDPDANSFVLFSGDDPVAATDQYSQHKTAKQQNTILVNGAGQFPTGRSEGLTFSQPSSSGSMLSMAKAFPPVSFNGSTLSEGEAMGSYPAISGTGAGARPSISRYRRIFLWSPNKYILVLDDLRSAQSVKFTSLVQGPGLTTTDSSLGLFNLVGASHSCGLQMVASQPLTFVPATSPADNKSTSLNYQQLQASATGSSVQIASLFNPWQTVNLRVALQNSTASGCDVAVSGNGISDTYRWTFAMDSQSPSSLVLPGIDTWRQTYFGTADETGFRADSANPAGDGLNNLLKYALGLNPNVSYSLATAGLSWVMPPMISGNLLMYTFTGTESDVTYIVEATSDLTGTWTPLYTHTGSAPGTVTVQDTQAVTAGSKRFMRLRVTHP